MVILTNAKRFSNRDVITWWILKSAKDDLSRIPAHAELQCATLSFLSDGCQFLFLSRRMLMVCRLWYLCDLLNIMFHCARANSSQLFYAQFIITKMYNTHYLNVYFVPQYSMPRWIMVYWPLVSRFMSVSLTLKSFFNLSIVSNNQGRGVLRPLACHSASTSV